MIVLCILGVFAVVTTTMMMFVLVHSGNISREEERERKEKMNNLKINLVKKENEDNE